MYSDPPHPTSSGTAINTVTAQLKTRASSEDLMRSCRAMDVPSRASRFRADPSTCRVPFCAKRVAESWGLVGTCRFSAMKLEQDRRGPCATVFAISAPPASPHDIGVSSA
jgi:hypothetical protein